MYYELKESIFYIIFFFKTLKARKTDIEMIQAGMAAETVKPANKPKYAFAAKMNIVFIINSKKKIYLLKQ